MKQPAYTYDELDEILRGNGRSGNVGISAIDGMIAALVAGPAFVHPEEWLPIIFAGRVPDVLEGTPEHLAVNTIFNRYNEVSLTLADNPQAYRPMFMNHEGRVIVSDWAAGFMLIVAKRPDAWTKILLTDTRKALAPIFASHELGVGFLLDIPKADIDKLRGVAHYYVADVVVALREACAPQRSAATEIPQSQRECLAKSEGLAAADAPCDESTAYDAVMPKNLDQIAADASEHVENTNMGIAPESFLDLQSQPVHASPHVRSPDRPPHPYTRRHRNHRERHGGTTCHFRG